MTALPGNQLAPCPETSSVPLIANAYLFLSRARAHARGRARVGGTHPPRGDHDDGAWSGGAPDENAYLFLSRARAHARGRVE